MPQFATADEFAARIGLELTDDETSRAETLLAIASGLIQDTTQQTIELVTDDELTMPGTSDDRILLPQRPVVEITSVTLDGDTLAEGSSWYQDGNAIQRIQQLLPQGLGALNGPFLIGTGFGRVTQTLVITYTHGYDDDEIPQTVKSICLEAAVRVWVNPGSVARESVGDTSTVYDNMRFSPTGLLLTDDERRALKRFFGHRATSLTIDG